MLTPLAIWLPVPSLTLDDGSWTPLGSSVHGPAGRAARGASVIETFARAGAPNVLDVWMRIVAFGVIVEMYLTLIGGSALHGRLV